MTRDPDSPDPSDRTMWRLEMTENLDEVLPNWRSMFGETQRDGWPVGWLDLATPPAGVVLSDFDDEEDSKKAQALPWQNHQTYYLLRPPEAVHDVWARAVPRHPSSYTVEAILLTGPVEYDRGRRRWSLLTADERPVILTDADGANPRSWLLCEDVVYDLSHDIEGGWEIWGRNATQP